MNTTRPKWKGGNLEVYIYLLIAVRQYLCLILEREKREEFPTLPLLQNTVIYIYKDESLATACRIIDNKKNFFQKNKKKQKNDGSTDKHE